MSLSPAFPLLSPNPLDDLARLLGDKVELFGVGKPAGYLFRRGERVNASGNLGASFCVDVQKAKDL